MSSQKMNLRLACVIGWILSLVMGSYTSSRAMDNFRNPLSTATKLSLNDTVYFEDSGNSRQLFDVELPSSGMLSLYVSTPSEGPTSSQPRILRIESSQYFPSVSQNGSDSYRVRELPQEVILYSRRSQSLRFAVGPEPSDQDLGALKLQVDFVPDRTFPDVLHPLDENPPESCEAVFTPVLGGDLFLPNQFVLATRPVDWTRDIEPEDCDIIDGNFANPGIVMIKATGSPLEASLFSSRDCRSDHRRGEGILGTLDSALLAPIYAGLHRLVLEPLDRNPVTYSLEVRHFDLCRNDTRDDHGDRPLCATEIEVGGTVYGEIHNTGGLDEDFFTVLLDQQQALYFQVAGDVNLELLDDRGQRLLYSSGEPQKPERQFVKTLGPGRFLVGLSAARHTRVDFSLSVHTGEDP